MFGRGRKESDLPNGEALADRLDEFLRGVQKGDVQLDDFIGGASQEVNDSRDQLIADIKEDFLVRQFPNTLNTQIDIREYAVYFKASFGKWSLGIYVELASSKEEIERKAAEVFKEQVTLLTLADFVRDKWGEASRNAGAALPGSPDEASCQKQATYWGRIEQIVQEAAEMKDEQ